MRAVVLVDGEHYPPAVRGALDELRAGGTEVLAAVFLGGTEKVGAEDLAAAYGGVEVVREPEREAALEAVLDRLRPEAVIDLSGEPVVSARDRMRLASLVLRRGARYVTADSEMRPPVLERVLTKPSIAVIATGKRVGKTAVAGALARHAVDRGRSPVIVAMGRGGPEQPEVLEVEHDVSPTALLALADAGKHAASDYVEDAVTSRVTTIGCRRVGDGLAGTPFHSNVAAGARIAESRDEDLVLLEGSGSAIPPVAAGATMLLVPATASDIGGHLTPMRLLMADVAVVTMAEQTSDAASVEAALRETNPGLEIVRTVFRPRPLATIDGKRIFVCSTAPERIAPVLRAHLEKTYDCEVVGWSGALADRTALERALGEAADHEVLLTELKAAAVDVAVRTGLARGLDVVFADNEPLPAAGGDDAVQRAFDRLLGLADDRSHMDGKRPG